MTHNPAQLIELMATYSLRYRIDKKHNNELALKYILKKRNIKKNTFSRKIRSKIYNFIINVPSDYFRAKFPKNADIRIKNNANYLL